MNEEMKELRINLLRVFTNEDNELNIKKIEIGLQDVIEKKYKEKCWWQVCNVGIFMELLGGITPLGLVEKIIASCEEYEKNI